MSLYDCHFDIIIRVEDPNGIKLNENIQNMAAELTKKIKENYPNSVVLPRGFSIVED
ncbi:MAG: hypothetical protein K6A34_06310 [Methanobrevibacter sp.]|nr:hypothetical protein [Methanobrevibacter sp.]